MSDTKTIARQSREERQRSGAKSCRRCSMPCCARRRPNGRSPGNTSMSRRQGTYTCAGCGQTLVRIRRQVRFRLRLAELHGAGGGEPCRRRARRHPRHGPDRSVMLEMQWPLGPRVRRRPRPDRPALLHQFGSAEVAAKEISRCRSSRFTQVSGIGRTGPSLQAEYALFPTDAAADLKLTPTVRRLGQLIMSLGYDPHYYRHHLSAGRLQRPVRRIWLWHTAIPGWVLAALF